MRGARSRCDAMPAVDFKRRIPAVISANFDGSVSVVVMWQPWE